jgi:hypothetical protein
MFHRTLLALFLFLAAMAAAQTERKPAARPEPKVPEDVQLYRNTTFGFRYRVPYGWVDRTKEMREPEATNEPDTKENPSRNVKGEVLLAVFERPPEAIGETINAAVVIATESAAAYPGLKKAEDYLSPLAELATAKGFKAAGDPLLVEIDARQLVRADFAKPLTDRLSMRQSTLILLVKGQIVSFTFIAGSDDELDDLIDRLHFSAAKSTAH